MIASPPGPHGRLRGHAEAAGIINPLPPIERPPAPVLELEMADIIAPDPWPLDTLLAAIGRRLRAWRAQ